MINLDYEKIGNLIKKLRTEFNMSTEDLAEIIGVSNVSVTQWENGNKRCSIKNIDKLSDFFNVSVEEIIEGKLHNEGSIDYLKRNFDLEPFDLDDLIARKKVNRLSDYFCKCISIKSRYYWLLPRWSRNELTDAEKEEYNYLKKYIRLDTRVFKNNYKRPSIYDEVQGIEDKSLKECVREYFDNISSLSDEAYEWEISKLVGFTFDIKASEVIKLGDIDCTSLMLNLCTQQYKDELVAVNVEGKTSQDLTNNEQICNLVWSGGNCVYRYMHSPSVVYEEELFEYIEGKIVEDIERTNAWEYCIRPGYNFAGHTQIYDYADEWKEISYEEYKKSIMTKKTKYIDDLGSIKYFDPQKFYENLLAGDYDTYLPEVTKNEALIN